MSFSHELSATIWRSQLPGTGCPSGCATRKLQNMVCSLPWKNANDRNRTSLASGECPTAPNGPSITDGSELLAATSIDEIKALNTKLLKHLLKEQADGVSLFPYNEARCRNLFLKLLDMLRVPAPNRPQRSYSAGFFIGGRGADMSESLTSISSGIAATTTARAAYSHHSDRVVPEATLSIARGAMLELYVVRVAQSQTIQAQIRLLGTHFAWSAPAQVELTADALDQMVASRLRGADNAPALPTQRRLLAEVVATVPRLLVRLLPANQQPAITRAQLPWSAAARLEWRNAQLRFHLPQATPLAKTMTRWDQMLAVSENRDVAGFASVVGTDQAASTVGSAFRQVGDGGVLHRAIERLLSMLPSSQQLTSAQQLAAFVEHSGLWLESSLAHLGTAPEGSKRLKLDLKGQLFEVARHLRLANTTRSAQMQQQPNARSALPNTPHGKASNLSLSTGNQQQAAAPPSPQAPSAAPLRESLAQPSPAQPLASLLNSLGKEAEGMVKQVVVQQLQTLELSGSQPHWCVALPFRIADRVCALEADIEQSTSGSEGNAERSWTVTLQLELPRLGQLAVRLNLRGDYLSAGLHAEQESSVALLRKQLAILRNNLESRDIEVTQLHASQQLPAARPIRSSDSPLLRESA